MELKAWKWWLNWGKVARQSNTDTLDLTYPAWRLVAEPRNGWNFFNLVLCHMVSMFNHVSPRMQPNKTEVSAELIRFPSSLWTPWVFHTIVVCDCVEPSWDHESFVYLTVCHSQKTSHCLWFLRIKLTFGAANCHYPELLPHDAHLTWKISFKHAAIFPTEKKSCPFCLETVRVSHVTRFEPKLRLKDDCCFKQIGNGNFCFEKNKNDAGFKLESSKSRSTESESSAVSFFLAPKRIRLKACWWVQR